MSGVQTSYSNFPATAFAGMLADDAENDLITGFNADTANMPFGVGLMFEYSPTYNTDMTLPTAAHGAALMSGILVHSHAHERQYYLSDGTLAGDLTGSALVPGAKLDVLRKGRVWVTVVQTVAVGDRLFVATSSDGTVYTAAGQIGNADVSSNTADCTRLGVFITAATAGGLAILEVDFVNRNS
jgi:hypothetical protein